MLRGGGEVVSPIISERGGDHIKVIWPWLSMPQGMANTAEKIPLIYLYAWVQQAGTAHVQASSLTITRAATNCFIAL